MKKLFTIISLAIAAILNAQTITDIIILDKDSVGLRGVHLDLKEGMKDAYAFLSDNDSCTIIGISPYHAYWTVENDSLFLTRTLKRKYFCIRNGDYDRYSFFKGREFANWYSGEFKTPNGKQVPCYSCVYKLYPSHTSFKIEKGIVVEKVEIDNTAELQRRHDLDTILKLEPIIAKDIQDLLQNSKIATYWDEELCDNDFRLKFSRNGKLKTVEFKDMDDLDQEDRKCLKKFKRVVKKYKLASLNLFREYFWIDLEIKYLDEFIVDHYN